MAAYLHLLISIIVVFASSSAFIIFSPIKPISQRVVGGYESSIEEIPWQASVEFANEHTCSGSIISNHFIITAAHCVFGKLFNQFRVCVGSSSRNIGGICNPLKRIISHAKFSPVTRDYDFALLELSIPLFFSPQVKAISLPHHSHIIKVNTRCLISAWGKNANPAETNEVLRATAVPSLDHAICKQKFFSKITAQMICAGFSEGGIDSCQEDPGGPIANKIGKDFFLIGIASGGYGCAKPNYPNVYARVSSARLWILKETGI